MQVFPEGVEKQLKRSCKVFPGELKRSCKGVERTCVLHASCLRGLANESPRNCKGFVNELFFACSLVWGSEGEAAKELQENCIYVHLC